MDENLDPIILDCGSGQTKVGYSTDKTPITFPTLLGDPPHPSSNNNTPRRRIGKVVGEEVERRWKEMEVREPVRRGGVVNWDWMEVVWEEAFWRVGGGADERGVLVTQMVREGEGEGGEERKKMIELLFETFDVPALFVEFAPVLSLFSSGKSTGVVVEVGEEVTQVVAVGEGGKVQRGGGCFKLGVGGRDVGEDLGRRLKERGVVVGMGLGERRRLVRDMVEGVGYVMEKEVERLPSSSSLSSPTIYTLPDGNKITILEKERFLGSELYFHPRPSPFHSPFPFTTSSPLPSSLLTLNPLFHSLPTSPSSPPPPPGLHHLTYHALSHHLHTTNTTNTTKTTTIALSGGGSLLPHFPTRLQTSLTSLLSSPPLALSPSPSPPPLPSSLSIKVVAGEGREVGAWVGGSVMVSLGTFQHKWLSKESYDESGTVRRIRKQF